MIIFLLLAFATRLQAHTWLFTRGRATMEASYEHPFRARKFAGGQGTHAQLGPGQEMVVRWAASHSNLFTLVVVAAVDQHIFYDPNYYAMVDSYIDEGVRLGLNNASGRPRSHGAPRRSRYINNEATYQVCAGGHCEDHLFTHEMADDDPAYVPHFKDMSGAQHNYKHAQYAFNATFTGNDVRVAYNNPRFPFFRAALRYPNLVNMHHEWDMVSMEVPADIPNKGQHYIVHFSSRSPTDRTYTDAVDVHAHAEAIPDHLIYGETSGDFDWVKIDHCQFLAPVNVVSPIRDAKDDALDCRADLTLANKKSYNYPLGINIVPVNNPDLVPGAVVREVEPVQEICQLKCVGSGQCRAAIAGTTKEAYCEPPHKIWTTPWANPAVSRQPYSELVGPRPGDYLEWTWDDAYHDVWQFPNDAAAEACDFSNATLLHKPVHHSYELPDGAATDGRALLQIPDGAAGRSLSFGCKQQQHCAAGQVMVVDVGEASQRDASLTVGMCPAAFELCPDNAIQGQTTSIFATEPNLPYLDQRGTQALRVGGTVTRASTPWAAWSRRTFEGHTCAFRTDNLAYMGRIGMKNPKGYWSWPNSTLREVVESCSSNFPDACNGIAWKRQGAAADSMLAGRHDFRRCLVTDSFTRVIDMGPSEGATSVTKPCPGCYTCREVLNPPFTFGNERSWSEMGFRIELSSVPGPDTTVTIATKAPKVARGADNVFGAYSTWGAYTGRHRQYTAEILCRVDASAVSAAPVLVADADWDTYLAPSEAGGWMGALQMGLEPLEAALATEQGVLNAVFAPGQQVDASEAIDDNGVAAPSLTDLTVPSIPWSSSSAPGSSSAPAAGEAAWPPVPVIKATFMPRLGSRVSRPGLPAAATNEEAAALAAEVAAAGWLVDHGDLFGARPGSGAQYGWRCPPRISWWGHGHLQVTDKNFAPFAFGCVHSVGDAIIDGIQTTTCPDGRKNTWDIEVDNGMYMVTVGHDNNMGQPAFAGCVFENVRPMTKGREFKHQHNVDFGSITHGTQVFSVEVLDGKFTMTSDIAVCGNVNWLKLDLISTSTSPAVWLPAPQQEWWQSELESPSAPIGLVSIVQHHQSGITSESFPYPDNSNNREALPDCRSSWLYGPSTCKRMWALGQKRGVHPDLALYPNHPGYTDSFMRWHFDALDTNKDGNVTVEEFKIESETNWGWHFFYGHWSLHMANTFFQLLDTTDPVTQAKDEVLTFDEFLSSRLSKPREDWCDPYEAHGKYARTGWCSKAASSKQKIPQEWGTFADQGATGAVIALSNTTCTDAEGCSEDEVVCDFVLTPQFDKNTDWRPTYFNVIRSGPVHVDCKGMVGRFLRVRLPGLGTRIFSAEAVKIHHAAMPVKDASPSSTDAEMPMACYGVEQRAPPTADDPDLLLKTKQHPMIIVINNPLDPIYYSTCYVRTILKAWLPLENEFRSSGGTAAPRDMWTLREGQCLACGSYQANYLVQNITYDSDNVPTPHWWTSPTPAPGTACEACIKITAPPTTQAQAAATAGAAAAAAVPPAVVQQDSITIMSAATPLTAAQEAASRRAYCEEYAAYTGIPIGYLACSIEVDLYVPGGRRLLITGTNYILSAWSSYEREEVVATTPDAEATPTATTFADTVAAKIAEETAIEVTAVPAPGIAVRPPSEEALATVRFVAKTAVEEVVVREVELVLDKIERGVELTMEEASVLGKVTLLLQGPGATGQPTSSPGPLAPSLSSVAGSPTPVQEFSAAPRASWSWCVAVVGPLLLLTLGRC